MTFWDYRRITDEGYSLLGLHNYKKINEQNAILIY